MGGTCLKFGVPQDVYAVGYSRCDGVFMSQNNIFFPAISFDVTDKPLSAMLFFFSGKTEILVVDIDTRKPVLDDHAVLFPSIQCFLCGQRRVGPFGNRKMDDVIFIDRKSTSLYYSDVKISYAVFC